MTSRDDLRIGDAERDAVMTALREHFAQGRLTHDELDERLDTALAARTAGDLRRVTADLPGPPPPRRPVEYDRPPAAGWAPPSQADLATWGHHMAAARRARFERRRGHHGRPSLFPIILLVIVAGFVIPHSLWPLGIVKVLIIGCIIFGLLSAFRHRHHHRHPGRRF
jgi:hypothetical protein